MPTAQLLATVNGHAQVVTVETRNLLRLANDKILAVQRLGMERKHAIDLPEVALVLTLEPDQGVLALTIGLRLGAGQVDFL